MSDDLLSRQLLLGDPAQNPLQTLRNFREGWTEVVLATGGRRKKTQHAPIIPAGGREPTFPIARLAVLPYAGSLPAIRLGSRRSQFADSLEAGLLANFGVPIRRFRSPPPLRETRSGEMENPNEAQLLRHCAQRGNERAWSEFIQRFGGQLQATVRYSLRRCGEAPSTDGVEELLQEVYCRLLENDGRHLRDCRGERDSEIAAYLARIAETVVRDQFRRRRALKRGGNCPVVRQIDKADSMATPFDTRGCPERRALARSHLLALFERYRAQGPRRRQERNLQVLLWSLVEGWTSREIAAALPGRPSPSSVNSLLYRLRRRLASVPTSSSLRRTQHAGALSDRTS